MNERQNILPALPGLSFGFGNVSVSMREEEGFRKEEFFLGLNGTYTLVISDSDVFRRCFPEKSGEGKLRAETLPIIKEVGAGVLKKYAECGEVFCCDIKSHREEIGRAICESLSGSAALSALGLDILRINIDNIITRRADAPITYTLHKTATASPVIKVVAGVLICFALAGVISAVMGKVDGGEKRTETASQTTELPLTSGTTSAATTPYTGTTVITEAPLPVTTTSQTTTEKQTKPVITVSTPQKEHFNGERFEYNDMQLRIENGRCIIEKYNGDAAEVCIPDEIDGYEVYRIEDSAFYGCTSLEKIRLPETLTEIGANAFHSCVFLQTIDIPENVSSIMNYAFAYCSSLKEVEVPDSVEEMGYCVFMNCIALERAILGGNYENFDGIFLYCYKLSYVKFPDGIKLMDGFRNCESMEEIHIPSSVRLIRGGAFSGCAKLTRVYLVDKMIIEKDAFRGCGSITFYLYADKIPDGYGDGWMPHGSKVVLAKEAQ